MDIDDPENGSGVWGEESDSNRSRGEASRDFAKLYELDSDPNRKEFLDDLFTFMQKRDSVSVHFKTTNETRRGKDPPTEDGNTHPLQGGTRGTVEPGGFRAPWE
ncbi:hypothetical protein QTP70_001035 [Hemibagrus guttatus]|uniref:AT-rich interactive domain-containing protein 3B n=1 Tax=Hemibagrus guttatus TaxID=175788 RepID=A0AAE0R8E1_9TELE|nr:hypothetical protein QTP70_001035 [Hemibagrus guttatus]KAK3569904.1 hypothetical protein QTP86_007345 [Hemibagrus guttatus]